MEKELNTNGRALASLLQTARQHIRGRRQRELVAQKVHIVGAGGAVTAAYEQLRNAAEYAEEHMLLQRAIRRFYRRLFILRDERQVAASGEELSIELTLAGYIQNDTIPEDTLSKISKLASDYYAAYIAMQTSREHPTPLVESWTIDVLAVKIEWLLNDAMISSVYVQFVYDHLLSSESLESLFDAKPADFELALYVAVHRALLKSDLAIVRASLLERYQQSPASRDAFIQTNQQIDALLSSPTVETLYRYVDRHGAPFRVLRHVLEDHDDVDEKLSRPNEFLSLYEAQIAAEYTSINARINKGIIKSVVFLIITKVLIGIAIEVPYDYVVLGGIAVLPLALNLIFPPIYMVLLRMTLMLPGPANTRRLVDQISEVLYGNQQKQLQKKATSFGVGFNIAYAVVFIIVFGGLGYLLWSLADFELMHLFIFFLFLSGASFLGFRLSRMIREVEAVDSEQNAITTARDFLYMPFVVVGRFMSEKYAKVNIVALALDMLIELPLKTILRLVRQWAAFISSKKDAL